LKSTKFILILFLLLSYLNNVSAGEYLGISMGQSSIDLEGYDPGFFYKIYGGIRNKYLGFEGSYNRLARFDISGKDNGSVSASGIAGSVIAFLPVISNFELFAKLGIFSWSATGEINTKPPINNKGTDITYAFGMQYNVSKKLTVRTEYQVYKDVLSGEVTSMTVGLGFRL